VRSLDAFHPCGQILAKHIAHEHGMPLGLAGGDETHGLNPLELALGSSEWIERPRRTTPIPDPQTPQKTPHGKDKRGDQKWSPVESAELNHGPRWLWYAQSSIRWEHGSNENCAVSKGHVSRVPSGDD
jgi:hypothetical protein